MINESGDQSTLSVKGGTQYAGTAEDLLSDSQPKDNASGLQTDSEYANDQEKSCQSFEKGRDISNNYNHYKKEKTRMPKDFEFPQSKPLP